MPFLAPHAPPFRLQPETGQKKLSYIQVNESRRRAESQKAVS
jgi:hypothetical protein